MIDVDTVSGITTQTDAVGYGIRQDKQNSVQRQRVKAFFTERMPSGAEQFSSGQALTTGLGKRGKTIE